MSQAAIKNFSQETLEINDFFSRQAGSEAIAGIVTIEVMSQICRKIKPKRILEMGGGIGTISYALLKHSDAFVDIYEHNEFCRGKLKENLAEFNGRYHVIDDYRILPPAREYDLLVVDGGSGKGMGGGYHEAVWFFIMYLKSIKIVYIEGNRRLQRFFSRKALKQNYIYKITNYDKIFRQGEKLHGGQKIECFYNSSRLIRLINFIFWELKEWTAAKYFFAYRLNKIKQLLGKKAN